MDELVKSIQNEPESLKIAALTQFGRELYQGSLYRTCKYLLGYQDIRWKTHGKMIDALESQTPRKLIVMPRGTFKSSIGCVGYPIWRLINDPNDRILIDSEVYSNSKNFLREIKSHLVSPIMTELFGEWKSDTNWNEGEITIRQRTKAYKESSITCGGIETVKVGQHYSCIVGDDLNSGNNSATPEACEKVITHFKMNQAILEPTGTYVIIGTRYAVNDIPGFILQNEVSA